MGGGGRFYTMLRRRWAGGSLVCVGIDPDLRRVPSSVGGSDAARVSRFCREMITATRESAAAFKLNSAFFEVLGSSGVLALEEVVAHARDAASDVPVILDAKRGDVTHTNVAYAHAVFDTLDVDAVTVHPYLGRISLMPFLERADRGVIVMGANSVQGAGEFQDLLVGPAHTPLYEHICREVAATWNTNGNCAVTAGATEPAKLGRIRQIVGDLPILLLGAGAQGGDIATSIRVGIGRDWFGLIVNSSRDILYASPAPDYAAAARRAAAGLNDHLAALASASGASADRS